MVESARIMIGVRRWTIQLPDRSLFFFGFRVRPIIRSEHERGQRGSLAHSKRVDVRTPLFVGKKVGMPMEAKRIGPCVHVRPVGYLEGTKRRILPAVDDDDVEIGGEGR